ncbi:MAG: ribonuclease P protein component [Candidatus Saganbacteria bacterium]|nr:ribonuclease P protein component [Candidatus Saganbacteria bacterium]
MKKSLLAEALKRGRHYTNRNTLSMVVGAGEKGQGSIIAIATKKKLGTAVTRNRIRRRIKAAMARLKGRIAKEKSIVVFPFIMAKNRQFSFLCSDVEQAFKEAGLLI